MKTVTAMDLEFSAVGFGAWAASGSDVWNGTDDEESIKAIQAAVDLGVTFFDVAPVYGLGHAEEILGKALGNNRNKVIVASKCGLVWDDNLNVTNNLTPESLDQEIDDSLRRLNTDYIDIYQIHWPDPNTPIEETIVKLLDIQKSGKIRYIGVSNFSIDLTKAAAEHGNIASHQGLYNLLERNPIQYHNIPLEYRSENEVLPYCSENGMAFFPYSPIFQGLLTDQFQHENQFDENDVRAANPKLNGELFEQYYQIRADLLQFAQEIEKPLVQIAINWLINQEAVTSVICGAQTVAHIEENVSSVSWELTPEMMTRIEDILQPYHNLVYTT